MNEETAEKLSMLQGNLDLVNRLLDDYERKGEKRNLAEAAMKIKTGVPLLKELKSRNSETKHDAEITRILKGYKDAYYRCKPPSTVSRTEPHHSLTVPTSTLLPRATDIEEKEKIAAPESEQFQYKENLTTPTIFPEVDVDKLLSQFVIEPSSSQTDGDQKVDLWEIAKEEQRKAACVTEYTFIVVGAKSSGKSSLISAAFDDDTLRKHSSKAIDFIFVNKKHLVNIWEVTEISRQVDSFIDICFSSQHIISTAIALTVDLTQISSFSSSLFAILQSLRDKSQNLFNSLKRSDNITAQAFAKRWNIDENNKNQVFTPTVVFGTHYEDFDRMTLDNKSFIFFLFRFLAAFFNVSVAFVDTDNNQQHRKRIKAMIYENLFNEKAVASSTSISVPLFIPRGHETTEAVEKEFKPYSNKNISSDLYLWIEEFKREFPQREESHLEIETSNDLSNEPLIDEIRKQKENEFVELDSEMVYQGNRSDE